MTERTLRESNSPQLQPPRPQVSTTSAPRSQPDVASDKATAAFIRRTLCSHNVLLGTGERARSTPRPIEEVLPPLTSSNAVDLQLYAIISVTIKEFVQTWYSKITPDHVFANEVIQLVAHCTRALETRLRKVDLESLLLDEIPDLLDAHVSAFRLAQHHASSGHSLVSDPRIVYHTLHPHPALSPVPTESAPSSIVEQRENESAWRQLLVQGVLAVLLPTEDLENGCLRALVAEIFAEMILGNGISAKVCEGWWLWEAITRIAEVLQHGPEEEDPQSTDAASEQSLSRLEHHGLLSTPVDGQVASAELQSPIDRRHEASSMSASGLFWALVQFAFLACTAVRAVIIGLATCQSLPPRSVTGTSSVSTVEAKDQSQLPDAAHPTGGGPVAFKRPMVSMKLWSCASRLVELDWRMPWLSGLVSMLHWMAVEGPGRVGGADGVLDRFLSHTMQTRVLNPAFLPILLRTIRATIFPNNAPGPTRQPPSHEEARNIKRRCAVSLLRALPKNVGNRFFASASTASQIAQVENLLDFLDDAYLNKHLIFQIVELLVVRLFPELGERGVSDLLEERLGSSLGDSR